MEAQSQISLVELVLLFTGDEFSRGCLNPVLVQEICRHWRPSTVTELTAQIYGTPNVEVGEEETVVIRLGFEWYRKELKRKDEHGTTDDPH